MWYIGGVMWCAKPTSDEKGGLSVVKYSYKGLIASSIII